jgi:hypothetical protein
MIGRVYSAVSDGIVAERRKAFSWRRPSLTAQILTLLRRWR